MDKNTPQEQMNEVFEEVAHYFSLLSEPTRLKILHALCNGERPVGEIVLHVQSTQANVSRQLNMLYRVGILGRRKEGAQVFYRIEDESTIDLCRSVCGKMASTHDDRIGRTKGSVARFMASGTKR
jgi:DNA-binding transcriptional ArsR family regulator